MRLLVGRWTICGSNHSFLFQKDTSPPPPPPLSSWSRSAIVLWQQLPKDSAAVVPHATLKMRQGASVARQSKDNGENDSLTVRKSVRASRNVSVGFPRNKATPPRARNLI